MARSRTLGAGRVRRARIVLRQQQERLPRKSKVGKAIA